MRFSYTALLALAATVAARPTPWSENLLDEIDALRAQGLSEKEIQSRHPIHITTPDRTQPVLRASTMLNTSPALPAEAAILPLSTDGNDLYDDSSAAPGLLNRVVSSICGKIPYLHGHAASGEKETQSRDETHRHLREQHVELRRLRHAGGGRGSEM